MVQTNNIERSVSFSYLLTTKLNMKEETVDSSENTVDRGQAKSFENLIIWQKTIYPIIPIYLLLTTFSFLLTTILPKTID